MVSPIKIDSAPQNLQRYLRMGDNVGPDKHNGTIDTDKEAGAAVAACSNSGGSCTELTNYLKAQGFKIENVEAANPANVQASSYKRIDGYFYVFGGLQLRQDTANGKYKLTGEQSYGGFGVDNGDREEATKIANRHSVQGANFVTLTITGSHPEFKVELNNNEVKWFPASAEGEVRVPIDASDNWMFPTGTINKFQILFKPGTVNCVISDIRVGY
jgi:hypothetical protein